MNKIFIISLIINCFLFSNTNWEVLRDKDVLIKAFIGDYPHCRAELLINYPMDRVLDVIEDVGNYKSFFSSIVISDINEFNEVRLAINMPFPFTDRDYTVKFKRLEDNNSISYLYEPIITQSFPEDRKYIRLIDARGGWTLVSIDNNSTLVMYDWNGDMRGNFPSWAYNKAWIRQGSEIMLDLREEINKRNAK